MRYLVIFLIITLTSCNKKKLKEIPVEFHGLWQWEYSVIYHNGMIFDTIQSTSDQVFQIDNNKKKMTFSYNSEKLLIVKSKDLQYEYRKSFFLDQHDLSFRSCQYGACYLETFVIDNNDNAVKSDYFPYSILIPGAYNTSNLNDDLSMAKKLTIRILNYKNPEEYRVINYYTKQ